MLSLILSAPPAGFTHCRLHQRAWGASLDRWVMFHVPTRDGSPGTDTPCDRCLAVPTAAPNVGDCADKACQEDTHDPRS
jgi:hypothetical protein